MSADLINIVYVVAAILFIFGLKGLTHPRTAVRGNWLGAVGMLLAVGVTLADRQVVGLWGIGIGVFVGIMVGAYAAIRVQMTEMPQMVALFNGFGGGASALVAGSTLMTFAGGISAQLAGLTEDQTTSALELIVSSNLQMSIATAASGLIGAITLTGSVIAFLKLQGWMTGQAILLPMRHVLNLLLFIASVALAWAVVENPDSSWQFWLLSLVSCALGVLLVIPIGGADMPVVIALLNSLSGVAAAATGFVLQNNVLIIAGSLVGASGIILTQIMCKAMNRSLFNVIFGVLGDGGGGSSSGSGDDIYEGRVKSTSPEEVAMMLDGASYVIIVPGYGMAVSQAQHAVRDLTNLLESKGTKVEFAIHPVAGRMPGHMNVLLAEANIDYDKLREMDDINPSFAQCDVALVCGANDVVNPIARTDPSSPIAGMPILDVDKARTVVVIKRSLSPGFAGIPNPLFAADNALMLFADGKKAFLDIIAAVKEG